MVQVIHMQMMFSVELRISSQNLEGQSRMKIKIMLLLTAMLANVDCQDVQAQTKYQLQDAAGKVIDAELSSIYGSAYSADFVYAFDSLLASNRDYSFLNPVEDPYGTLKDCFIFVGGPDGFHKNIVGIYKDGHILWHSDTLKCYAGLNLFTTRDLNNDGTVDLVFKAGLEDGQLWIFSWDGHVGTRINAVNENGESVIDADVQQHYFSFVDVEGDGVWEIQNNWTKDGSTSWSWNGHEYGHWSNTPNTSIAFPPRNKIDIVATSLVNRQNDTLFFEYQIFNKPQSKQQVEDFRVWCAAQHVLMLSTPPYWSYFNKAGGGYGWQTLVESHTGHIYAGKTVTGFSVKAKALCSIVGFDSHGYNGIGWTKDWTNDLQKTKLILKDQLENAYLGKTLGPADPPSPFVPLNFLDTISNFTTQSRSLGWIKDQVTTNKYLGYFGSAKSSLQQNNITSTRTTLQQVLQDVNIDSTSNLTSEAYALIRYNTEYLLAQLPTAPVAGCNVKLVGSSGSKLAGGSLQYYEGSWKDATNNNDGTFFVNTTAKTLSLRMTYEYGSQTKSNVAVGPDTAVFQTVNAQVKLQNSLGAPIDTGSVQYYAGAWRNFGTTSNGIAAKELLPANYSFRITYAYASKDKQQDIGANATVVFQTVNASVQLQNSQGTLIDQGVVQYYSGAWRDFGSTTNGVANKELLPNNYSFRMSYAYASKDKQQDIGTNPTVVFQTVNAAVQLQNSQGALIDQGTVQYYSGAWREFGSTTNGVANKELLPNNYSFRMTYAYASKDKQQDIGANPTVVFQTVNATVQLKNSLGNLIDQGTVQYYSGAWRAFGTTVNGVANKELLPNNYSFRMTNEYVSLDKSQDLSTNSTVDFSTVLCTISVKNAQNQSVDGAAASYYSGAWRQIGNTVGGQVTKELLPVNLTFRVKYGSQRQDKQQNLSTNNVVEFAVQ
jgi:hypothetical protein